MRLCVRASLKSVPRVSPGHSFEAPNACCARDMLPQESKEALIQNAEFIAFNAKIKKMRKIMKHMFFHYFSLSDAFKELFNLRI